MIRTQIGLLTLFSGLVMHGVHESNVSQFRAEAELDNSQAVVPVFQSDHTAEAEQTVPAPSPAGVEHQDAQQPQEAAPAGSIEWREPGDLRPGYPTWVHYYGDNCRACEVEAAHFADQEVVKQSRAWNCVRVRVTRGVVPRDRFLPPAASGRKDFAEVVGFPVDGTALDLAQRLYSHWAPAMEKSVVVRRVQHRVLRRWVR